MINPAPTTRPSFLTCVETAWMNDELMKEYRRLTGSTLGRDRRAPIERMIDDATGHVSTAGFGAFLRFVYDCIWTRLPGAVDTDDAVTVMLLIGPDALRDCRRG